MYINTIIIKYLVMWEAPDTTAVSMPGFSRLLPFVFCTSIDEQKPVSAIHLPSGYVLSMTLRNVVHCFIVLSTCALLTLSTHLFYKFSSKSTFSVPQSYVSIFLIFYVWDPYSKTLHQSHPQVQIHSPAENC